MMPLETPRANRLHIGLFGRRNVGKSSLFNALAGQEAAIVSATAGSTADPVYKAMELHGLGPIVFFDTAGMDDEGPVGTLRAQKSREQLGKADAAILALDAQAQDFSWEKRFCQSLPLNGQTLLLVLNKADLLSPAQLEAKLAAAAAQFGRRPLAVSAQSRQGIGALKDLLASSLSKKEEPLLVAHKLPRGAFVWLVMPQDKQAPKGRLILPQAQTLRELLDHNCNAWCLTPENLNWAMEKTPQPPDLVIVDSQIFSLAAASLPAAWPLTSFSLLMSGRKSRLALLKAGADAALGLKSGDKALILEACAHHALKNDIGREQIPQALAQLAGFPVKTVIHTGPGLPANAGQFALAVQCGSCMLTRAEALNRIDALAAAHVPVTNYGMVLAAAAGILPRVWLPL